MVNNSTGFLLPVTGIKYSRALADGFVNFYVTADWNYLTSKLILVSSSTETKEQFTSGKGFVRSYSGPQGLLYEYDLSMEQRFAILKPFLEGRYSQIDREYVEQNFSPMIVNSQGKCEPNGNYQILTKAEPMRLWWEEKLGMELGDREVWSRPLKEKESYEVAEEAG